MKEEKLFLLSSHNELLVPSLRIFKQSYNNHKISNYQREQHFLCHRVWNKSKLWDRECLIINRRIWSGPVDDVEYGESRENDKKQTKLEKNILLRGWLNLRDRSSNIILAIILKLTLPTSPSSLEDQADLGLTLLSTSTSPSSFRMTPYDRIFCEDV